MSKKTFTPEQQAANRETLKAALRSHAAQFDMETWLERKDESGPYPRTLRQFEACGTACCIDGMAIVLWQKGELDIEEIEVGDTIEAACGLPRKACFNDEWDEDLVDAYDEAIYDNDRSAMVEAACQQIDRLAAAL